MVREVNFDANSMIGKPVAGLPVRLGIKTIGHVVSVKDNKVTCAIDDDGKIMSLLRTDNPVSLEVVRR